MRLTYRTFSTGAIAALLAACSSSTTSSPIEKAGKGSSADTATLCTDRSLYAPPSTGSPDDVVCSGPWEYQAACSRVIQDTPCSKSGTYQQHACDKTNATACSTCTNCAGRFTPNGTTQSIPGQIVSGTPRTQTVCSCPGIDDGDPRNGSRAVRQPARGATPDGCPGGGRPVCEQVITYENFQPSCDKIAGVLAANERAKWPSDANLSALTGTGVLAAGVAGDPSKMYCNVTLNHVPQWNAMCIPSGQCDDFSRPNYTQCTVRVAGPSCPTSIGTQYATPGQSLRQLRSQFEHPGQLGTDGTSKTNDVIEDGYPAPGIPRCFTCENIPVDTTAHVSAKFECLMASVAEQDQGSPPFNASAYSILSTLDELVELKGDMLTSSQIDRAIGVFPNWDAPNCGDTTGRVLDFESDDPDGCYNQYPDYQAAKVTLDLCQRLPLSHVPANVAGSAVNPLFDR